jgi:hypothetical protein
MYVCVCVCVCVYVCVTLELRRLFIVLLTEVFHGVY